jgi:2-polyprenyl-3-methyl-5-hydroxy-6-metoxy-1,4-benzoquinol methylase
VLAQQVPQLELAGVDRDERKIERAKVACSGLDLAVDFKVGDVESLEPHTLDWDVVTIVDVLYLLPAHDWIRVLSACRARMRPGAKLLLKEMTPRARVRLALLRAQERLAVNVLGWTQQGSHTDFEFPNEEELGRRFAEAGLELDHSVSLPRRSIYPHALWVATCAG